MAMIKCPECGKDISDQANSCPNCGFPVFIQANNQVNSNYGNTAQNIGMPQQNNPPNQNKKDNTGKKVAKGCGCGCGTIFLLFLLFAFIGSCSDLQTDNENVSIETTQSTQENNTTEEQTEENLQQDEKQENNTELSDNLFLAVQSIGMEAENVKNISTLDDWASGHRYSFVYNGFKYIVYELDNGEINSIETEHERVKIYERGYEPLNYKDFEPDETILQGLTEKAIDTVSNYITNESRIKDKGIYKQYSRIYDYYIVHGELEASNELMNQTYEYTVHFTVTDGNYAETRLVVVDGKIVYGSEDYKPNIEKVEIQEQEDSSTDDKITLKYGTMGKYGSKDYPDDDKHIRYHIPAGKYKVVCDVRGGFFILTNELHDENGEMVDDVISQHDIDSSNTINIEIEENQCILLYMNTEITLYKVE